MDKILIFTDRTRAGFATAVKQNLMSQMKDALIIILDDLELHANAIYDFIENFMPLKVNKEKREAIKEEKRIKKNVDELPEFTWEFKEGEESYVKMRGYFQKFNPTLVITIGYGAYLEAIATRDSLGVRTKVINVIDDYTLNKALVNPYMDGYVVENLPLKKMLVACGVDASKVVLSPLPIENKYFDEKEREGNVYLPLNRTMETMLYMGSSEDCDHKKTFHILKEYEHKFNVVIYSGYNRESYKTALKMGLNAYNEGASLPMLYDKADVVLTPGTSYDILTARNLGKLVAVTPGGLEMEKRNATYLKSIVVDCTSFDKLESFLKGYEKSKYFSTALRSTLSIKADLYSVIKKLVY